MLVLVEDVLACQVFQQGLNAFFARLVSVQVLHIFSVWSQVQAQKTNAVFTAVLVERILPSFLVGHLNAVRIRLLAPLG